MGVSLVPLSAAIEVDVTRSAIRRRIAGIGEPLLLIRLGHPDPDRAGPPHTPRLQPSQTIEIVA